MLTFPKLYQFFSFSFNISDEIVGLPVCHIQLSFLKSLLFLFFFPTSGPWFHLVFEDARNRTHNHGLWLGSWTIRGVFSLNCIVPIHLKQAPKRITKWQPCCTFKIKILIPNEQLKKKRTTRTTMRRGRGKMKKDKRGKNHLHHWRTLFHYNQMLEGKQTRERESKT